MRATAFVSAIALLSSVHVAADYVSPLKYKGFSCDELRAEEAFLAISGADAYTKMLSASMNNDHVEHVRLSSLHGSIEAHRAALAEAMKRIDCKPLEKQ